MGYIEKGEYEEASGYLDKALQMEPRNAEMLDLRRRILVEKEEYKRQEREMSRRALGGGEGAMNAEKWFDLGEMFLKIVLTFLVLLVEHAFKLFVEIISSAKSYLMSYWFIRIPINIFVVIPWRISKDIFYWAISGMEEAYDAANRGT